ncbi:MAG: leucine-rich repeat domain-containing protein [Clostridia bacterium]|nr:leucine-rich repeat domain-containing protein [Clostridia bacterium]
MRRILAFLLVLLMLALPLASCDTGVAAVNRENPKGNKEVRVVTETETVDVVVPYLFSVANGKATLLRYTGEESAVVIPETIGEYPVEAIGRLCFANNQKLTSVEIPGTLKSTGELAFYHCDQLTTVILHEGLEEIGYASFSECGLLNAITLPSTVRTINMAAFKDCMALTAIEMEGVTLIEDAAFNHSGLTSVTVPASVETVGEEAFMDCPNLVSVVWNSIANVREKTFEFCYALTDVQFNAGAQRIYDWAFARCTALKTISFPAWTTRFYNHAFYGCTSLESVYIMNPWIDRLDDMAFHFVPELKDVYYAGSESQWKSISNSSAFYNEGLRFATLHFDYQG